jgi:RNA-binding protein
MFELQSTFKNSNKRKKKEVLTPKMKQRIKNKLRTEKPTIHVGKEGVTDKIVQEIKKQLDAREKIKVKILKTALQEKEAKAIAIEIAEKTKSELIEVRGHTFILFKQKKKQ